MGHKKSSRSVYVSGISTVLCVAFPYRFRVYNFLILTRSTWERTTVGVERTTVGVERTTVYSRGSSVPIPHVPTSGKGQFLGCAESVVLT